MSFPSRTRRASLLLGTVTLFTTPGCTLVGYGIGSAIDSGTGGWVSVETLDTNVVAPGKKVDVYLSDGSKLTGIFRGLEPTPAPEYAKSYLAARRSLRLGVSLPTPGDSITLYTTSSPPLRGVFLGYDPGAVVLATAGGTVAVSVQDLQELDFARGRARSADVRSALDDSQIPFLSVLRIERGQASTQSVQLRRISRVEWRPRTGRTVGWIMGAAVDLYLIIALFLAEDTSLLGGYSVF